MSPRWSPEYLHTYENMFLRPQGPPKSALERLPRPHHNSPQDSSHRTSAWPSSSRSGSPHASHPSCSSLCLVYPLSTLTLLPVPNLKSHDPTLSLSLKRAPLPTSAPHQLLPLAFPIVYLASPRLAHSFSAQPAHEHQTFQNPLRVRPRLVCANYVGTVAPAPPSKTHAWIRAACNVHAGTGKLSLARLHRLCCCFLLLGETMGSLARSVTARPLEKVQIAGR